MNTGPSTVASGLVSAPKVPLATNSALYSHPPRIEVASEPGNQGNPDIEVVVHRRSRRKQAFQLYDGRVLAVEQLIQIHPLGGQLRQDVLLEIRANLRRAIGRARARQTAHEAIAFDRDGSGFATSASEPTVTPRSAWGVRVTTSAFWVFSFWQPPATANTTATPAQKQGLPTKISHSRIPP